MSHRKFCFTAILLISLILCFSLYSQEMVKTWERFYRSSQDTSTFYNEITGLVAMQDGGFVVSSFYERYFVGPINWIFRADRDGEIIWEVRWDADSFNNKRALLTRLNDEELLFADMVYAGDIIQPRLTCLSNDGEIHWEHIYHSNFNDYPVGLKILQDNAILLTKMRFFRDDSLFNNLVFIDREGNILDSCSLPLLTGSKFSQLEDGRLVFRANIKTDAYHWAPALLITDSRGDSLDFFQYEDRLYLRAKGITITPDGEILTYSYYGDFNYQPQIIKINRNFQVIWDEYYEGRRQSKFIDLAVMPDGRIVFAGQTLSMYYAWAGVINSWGEFACEITDEGYGFDSNFSFVKVTGDNEVTVLGITLNDMNEYPARPSIWVARLSIPPLDAPDSHSVTSPLSLEAPYPNPFNSSFIIPFHLDFQGDVNIKLFDAAGRECFDVSRNIITPGDHLFTVDSHQIMNGLPGGFYFVNVRSGGKSLTKTITHLK